MGETAQNLFDDRQGPAIDAEKIQLLKEYALFASIKDIPEAIDALSRVTVEKTFKKGSSIIAEGKMGSEAYFLIEGSIKVSKTIGGGESFPVAVLKAEDRPFFGESALLEKDVRSATIQTQSDCLCLVLEKHSFDDFCLQHPQWALPLVLHIARVIMQRLRKSNEDVIQLYNALVNEVRGT